MTSSLFSPSENDVDRASLLGPARPTPGEPAARARRVLVTALEGLEAVVGAWECGSAAFGRADVASDVDICIVARDGAAAAVLAALDEAVSAELSGAVVTCHEGATQFGMQQIWQPAPAAGGLDSMALLDVAVAEQHAQAEMWHALLDPERHGRALLLLDADGSIEQVRRARPAVAADDIRQRIEALRDRIAQRRHLLGSFAAKELDRGRLVDAHWTHRRFVVHPLVDLLNIWYRPLRHDYSMRYVHDELPPGVVEQLVPLVQVGSEGELRSASQLALQWMDAMLDAIDVDDLPVEAHAEQMRAAFG